MPSLTGSCVSEAPILCNIAWLPQPPLPPAKLPSLSRATRGFACQLGIRGRAHRTFKQCSLSHVWGVGGGTNSVRSKSNEDVNDSWMQGFQSWSQVADRIVLHHADPLKGQVSGAMASLPPVAAADPPSSLRRRRKDRSHHVLPFPCCSCCCCCFSSSFFPSEEEERKSKVTSSPGT